MSLNYFALRPAVSTRPEPRNQHRCPCSVVDIHIPECRYQISLLEANGNQDVRRGDQREDQVRHRHGWCRPENRQPADVEWMAHQLIKAGRAEYGRAIGLVGETPPHLLQSEQIKVIDKEG